MRVLAEYWLIQTLAISCISMTLARSSVFAGLRKRLHESIPLLGKLVSCPYCLSHWLAFLFCIPALWTGGVIAYLLLSFAVVTVAAFGSLVIKKAYFDIDQSLLAPLLDVVEYDSARLDALEAERAPINAQ